MTIEPHTCKHQCQYNDLMQSLDTERATAAKYIDLHRRVMDERDTERAAHEATKAELQALREAAQGACDWMEGVRASGDAGNWNWKEGDEYSKLLQALTRKEA